MSQKDSYNEYMSSTTWKKKRQEFIRSNFNKDLNRSNGDVSRCFMCDDCQWNYRMDELEVHHKHYNTFRAESRSDVEVLCQKCHAKADLTRKIEVKEQNEQALEDARFYGYLRKKHGEDYPLDDLDLERESEEFEEMLERIESQMM